MWCSYEDSICLNPLCLVGCVSLENKRRHDEKSAEIIVRALEARVKGAKGVCDDEIRG